MQSRVVFRQEEDGKWIVGLVSPGTDRICLQYGEKFDTAAEAAAKKDELEEELGQVKGKEKVLRSFLMSGGVLREKMRTAV